MKREDVVMMAKEAGIHVVRGVSLVEKLSRFAALVAAHERDRATKICEYAMQMYKNNQNLSPDQSKVGFLSAEFCAAHIKSGESWS